MNSRSKSLDAILDDKSQCLGSYVFLWGQKQEHTSTWFGLFTEEGEESAVMDVLIQGWSGADPDNWAPTIENYKLNGKSATANITVPPGEEMNASVTIEDKEGDPLLFEWRQFFPGMTIYELNRASKNDRQLRVLMELRGAGLRLAFMIVFPALYVGIFILPGVYEFLQNFVL